MDSISKKHGVAANSARLRHIESLLARYPELSSEEEAEVLHYLRKGPLLDLGLLTGMESIRHALARFREDHRRELGLQPRDFLAPAAILLFVLIVGALAWNAGTG